MKRRILMALVSLTLVLSLVLAVLPGCGGGTTPTATQPTATTPGATTPGATTPGKTTVAPPPVKAGEVIKWRFQSSATAGSPTYWCFKKFEEDIKIMSGGRLEIEVFPSGAIIGSTELFDAAMTGALEMTGGLCNCNWSGKGKIFELAGQIAGGMTPYVHLLWLYYETPDGPGPAMKLYDKLYTKFGIKLIPFNSGIRSSEAEYLANKPLLKPADFKGLTFRGTGWSALTAQEFGAKGVFVPATDVYSALQTGVIDACELGTPNSNYVQGYNDITKYTGFPGIHKLSEASDAMVNLQIWNKLPADLQMIVLACALKFGIRSGAYETVESAKLMDSGILQKKGVTITYETPEMQNTWRTTSWGLADKEAAKDADFKEWWDTMRNFQIMVDKYVDLQTPRYGPDYPGNKDTYPGIKY